MTEYISQAQIRSQAWKFYFVAVAWPIYIFLLPSLYASYRPWSIAFMIFPGVYLFTWMSCLMHECWHKYVPNINNDAFYYLLSYMLVTDPQMYKILHGHHHSQVNTYEDVEFHPLGRIKNLTLKKIHNLLEIIFGVIWTFGLHMFIVPRHPKYKAKFRESRRIVAIALWFIFYGTLGVASAKVFSLKGSQVGISLAINFWLCAFFIHQTQMIEHAGLITKGDWNQRNVTTRNLRADGIAEKLFLWLTHNDVREHTLHHTVVKIYSRPFPGKVPMPQEAVYVSMTQYLAILRQMLTKGYSPDEHV